jgi:hypothetical protein
MKNIVQVFSTQGSKLTGMKKLDPYLIGYCKVHNCVLITNEKKEAHNRIPAVSEKNQVKCINIYDFLLERGLRMERKK